MSSNALLWPSQGTIVEERFDKYKWLRQPSQGFAGVGPTPEIEESFDDGLGNSGFVTFDDGLGNSGFVLVEES